MRNVKWYILGLAALGAAFLLHSPYMVYAIYAFILLLFLAWYSSWAWLYGLDSERKVSNTMLHQGDQTEVEVTIKNDRGWPIPWIYFEDHHPADFPRIGLNKRLAILMPGRSVTLKYSLTCPRRGYHRIGPVMMESGDLFGLQKRFRTGEHREYVSVLPTVAYIETYNLATKRPQGPVRISNRIYEDPTRINQIRKYAPGDPLRSIHWKATARTGELQVKTHDPSSVVGATLVLDLHEDSYVPEHKDERMELAITTAASIAYLLQLSGEQLGLITNGIDAAEVAKYHADPEMALSRYEAAESMKGEAVSEKINPLTVPTARSPIQAQMIIENLARVIPGRGLDATELVMNEFRRLPRDAALLVIGGNMDERMALALGSMKQSGFNVNMFYMRDRKGYERAVSLLGQHNIHVFHIEHERSLHELSPARIGQ